MAEEAEAERMIQDFAEITATDEAFAHYMLQEHDYDLNRALTSFFNSTNEQSQSMPAASSQQKLPKALSPEIKAAEGSNDDHDDQIKIPNKTMQSEERMESTPRAQPTTEHAEDLPSELTLISWNIDGLDERNQRRRFTAVLYIIAKANPEVIFLQEMVTPLLPMLNDLLAPMYHICVQNPDGKYFCVTLISKNIKILSHEVIPFENSTMGRGMQIVEAEWDWLKLRLLNTHLESGKEYSEQRRFQFGRCIERMIFMAASNPEETLAIFGGDLNIRDKEIGDALPISIKDAWIMAGSKPQHRYTWDQHINDNYAGRFGGGENTSGWKGPKARFDRIFFSAPPDTKVDFQLEGTSRIRDVNCFASDHFAMVCRFLLTLKTALPK